MVAAQCCVLATSDVNSIDDNTLRRDVHADQASIAKTLRLLQRLQPAPGRFPPSLAHKCVDNDGQHGRRFGCKEQLRQGLQPWRVAGPDMMGPSSPTDS